MKDIKIVIGANFGDEGKGKLTDYYTKNADDCIVVCSNGGAQRGHTVLKSDGTTCLSPFRIWNVKWSRYLFTGGFYFKSSGI